MARAQDAFPVQAMPAELQRQADILVNNSLAELIREAGGTITLPAHRLNCRRQPITFSFDGRNITFSIPESPDHDQPDRQDHQGT